MYEYSAEIFFESLENMYWESQNHMGAFLHVYAARYGLHCSSIHFHSSGPTFSTGGPTNLDSWPHGANQLPVMLAVSGAVPT